MLTPDDRRHLERLTTEHANAALDLVRASQRKHDALEFILDAMNAHLISRTSEAYQDGLRTRPDPNSFVAGWEATARACGFEGVTEALGYLLTKEEMQSLKIRATYATIPAPTEVIMREFCGWISGDLEYLQRAPVSEIADSLERFKKARAKAMANDEAMPGFDILAFRDQPIDLATITPTLTATSGLDTLTDAPDAIPFPLPDFIPPPPRTGLDPPVVHDPDAPAPQDRCLCKVCNDERARLRTFRRPPQVA